MYLVPGTTTFALAVKIALLVASDSSRSICIPVISIQERRRSNFPDEKSAFARSARAHVP